MFVQPLLSVIFLYTGVFFFLPHPLSLIYDNIDAKDCAL